MKKYLLSVFKNTTTNKYDIQMEKVDVNNILELAINPNKPVEQKYNLNFNIKNPNCVSPNDKLMGTMLNYVEEVVYETDDPEIIGKDFEDSYNSCANIQFKKTIIKSSDLDFMNLPIEFIEGVDEFIKKQEELLERFNKRNKTL